MTDPSKRSVFMYYEIVPMDRSHVPQVAALERECFSMPWSETMLEASL